MAGYYSNYSNRGRGGSRRRSKYTTLERTAFNMGLISRGIQNKESRVFESFNNGLNAKSGRTKKPII